MRPNPNDLPEALRPVATKIGLEFLTNAPFGSNPYPVACGKLPIFEDPNEVNRLPVQMNFHYAELDMDKQEDRVELEKVMTYLAAGYGMRLVSKTEILVKKKKQTTATIADDETSRKKTKIVRRVYLEYYAPYRVIMDNQIKDESHE